MWRGLSQAYFSRGYLEEVNAGNANTSNWLQGGGINQDGEAVLEAMTPDAYVQMLETWNRLIRATCSWRLNNKAPWQVW